MLLTEQKQSASSFFDIYEVSLGIHDLSRAAGSSGVSVRLEDFREAASTHDQVIINHDGQKWSVKGIGSMPGSQRQVAWVQPHDSQTDTTSIFVEALQRSYSSGIARAVAHALDLQQSPGKPLAARTVTTALDMASTSQNALKGVDFLTELHFSAVNTGAGFTSVCQAIGLDHTQLDSSRMQQIDQGMAALFEAAEQEGRAPVSNDQAAKWLQQILRN